ncbi:MAG: translation elongation factor Ts, partial [Chloroflexota bacterium]
MVKVTAAMVKELREATGAGPLDIKKALEATDGDKQAAVDYLREKGIAKAAKKLGKDRSMNEGTVALWKDADESPSHVVMVQVNCETDFVGTNEKFVAFSEELATHIAHENPADLETMMGQTLHGSDVPVEERLKVAIAELGEKMEIGGMSNVKTNGGTIGVYQHFNKRIGAMVELDKPGLDELARNIAMHTSNLKPLYITRDDVPADVVEHERTVQKNRAIEEGKPENIAEKMVEGRMGKFYAEICLVEQDYLMDDDKTIADLLKENDTSVREMARFAVGEGADDEGDVE